MRQYIVRPGDTFYSIAARLGLTLAQLLAANPQITNTSSLSVGQVINLPFTALPTLPTIYTIRPGDTLTAIAQRYGLTLSQLLAANPQITNPNLISPGMRISLPASMSLSGTTTYTVRPGDTLYAIAGRFGTSVDAILRLNPGINPYMLSPGQQLIVPATSAAPQGCITYYTINDEIWRSDAAGRNKLRLTSGQTFKYNIKWSPNGKYISYLYNTDEAQVGTSLVIMDPCGKNPRTLTDVEFGAYAWSNDSGRIAYGLNGLYVLDLAGEGRRVMEGGINPIWSLQWFPGNTRIAGTMDGTLFTIDVSGQNFRRYDNVPVSNQIYLSPNGRYVASDISIYDFSTGRSVNLPCTGGFGRRGGWSPDSSMFTCNGNQIVIVNPQGAVIKTIPGGVSNGFGPSNDWILFRPNYPVVQKGEATIRSQLDVMNIRTGQRINIAQNVNQAAWTGQRCPQCSS